MRGWIPAMEILGYSERGLINAFFYGAKAKNNPVEIIGEFLKCLRDRRNRQFFDSTDDPSEILVLVEPSLGKGAGFGDPDFIIRFRLDRKRYLIYFQVKSENFRQSRGRKNSSSISDQLILSDEFGTRFAEIPLADLREKGIATRRKKLKDSFVIRQILIERLGNYRANFFSGCITADPANPLCSAKHKGYSFCWMGLHELYRIAKDFEITDYLEAADFNRDKRVFSGSVDLADLQSETMYPAVRKSYNILKKIYRKVHRRKR